VVKIEVTKRSKVRRNYLSYMRERTGKSARLIGVEFDRTQVNAIHDKKAEEEQEKLHAEAELAAAAKAEAKAAEAAEIEAKAEAVIAARQTEA
jgi:large subunit ribosomal protein L19